MAQQNGKGGGRAKGGESKGREADRRRTILRAAIEVFARKGYHGCRIADVAKQAKVAYGLVYHYFQNKEELLQSVFEAGWGGYVSQLRAICEGEAPLDRKVRDIAHVSFQAYWTDPRAVKVLILEIARNPGGGKLHRTTAFTEVIQLVHAMFRHAQERGELREGADPLMCATLLFGAIEMGVTAFVLGLAEARDETALTRAERQVADAFLHGVVQPQAEEVPWKKDRSSTRLRAARRS